MQGLIIFMHIKEQRSTAKLQTCIFDRYRIPYRDRLLLYDELSSGDTSGLKWVRKPLELH
jgi:hypothetical protein